MPTNAWFSFSMEPTWVAVGAAEEEEGECEEVVEKDEVDEVEVED